MSGTNCRPAWSLPSRHRALGRRAVQSGFSLLEVILALAILAGSFAALGEVMRLGNRNAQQARDVTRAEMLAESVMAELVAGARPLTAASGTFDLDADPPWAFDIAVEPTEFMELLLVTVRVEQQQSPVQRPARCDLVRWLPHPDYLPSPASQPMPAPGGETDSSAAGNNDGGGSPPGGAP